MQELHFNLQRTVVAICTTCFNIKLHCIFPTQLTYLYLAYDFRNKQCLFAPYSIKQLIFIMEFVSICYEAGTKF